MLTHMPQRPHEATVCFFTSAHDPFDFRIFHKECKSLARDGYRVTLVAPHPTDEVVEGIQIRGITKANNRLGRMLVTTWRAFKKSVQQDADVYHFHDPELIPAGLLLRLRRKKVVRDVREDFPSLILEKPYIPRWIKPIISWVVGKLEKFASRHTSAIVAATPGIAERFRRLNPETATVRNYPSLEELRQLNVPAFGERPNWVIYSGSLSERRGLLEMIEAMRLLRSDLGVRLKLAGCFSPPRLLADVRSRAGWESVDFLGYLGRPSLLSLLVHGRVGLVTMHRTRHIAAAWPVKLFEYMLAGMPVIVSDIPLWREIVERAGCGIVVDPQSPASIATAIERILSYPEEAESMGQNGFRAVCETYNWANEEKTLLSLYHRLLRIPTPRLREMFTVSN